MAKLSLHLIETFLVFSESSNIIEAAQRLRLSQPTVTYQLKQMEEQVGLPLFRQEGRKKVLTSFGERLKQSLQKEFGQFEATIQKAVVHLHRDHAPEVRIGTRREILSQIHVPKRWSGRAHYLAMSSDEAIRRLKNGSLEVAITRKLPTVGDLQMKKLFSSRSIFAVHPKQLQGRNVIQAMQDPEFLKKNICWAYNEDMPYLKNWVEHCQVSTSELNIKAYCEDWSVLFNWLEDNGGYTVLPTGIIRKKTIIETAPIDSRIIEPTTYYAVFNKDMKSIVGFDDLLAALIPKD